VLPAAAAVLLSLISIHLLLLFGPISQTKTNTNLQIIKSHTSRSDNPDPDRSALHPFRPLRMAQPLQFTKRKKTRNVQCLINGNLPIH
jgi:hypothetical protein